MKMNNKQKMKIIVIALLAMLLGTFTHCMPTNSIQVGESGDEYNSGNNSSNAPKDEGQIIHETQVSTGVKNHEQILLTMGSVTGIDPYGNTGIMNIYREVEMSLPTDNDVKVYSSTQQVAVTKLAAEFCKVLTDSQALRDEVWPGLLYGNAPATALSPNNRITFVNNTIVSFWGGMITTEEAEIAHDEFDALMTDLIGTDTNSGATQRAVRGVCIAALSSAYVTLL